MKQVVSYYLMVNKTYKELQEKLNNCFNLIEDCFWDLQDVYDETKNTYAFKDNNSAILPYGLWKFYIIEEWVKEIKIEKAKGLYTLSCNNFCDLVNKYAVWKPKDISEWNTDSDLLGIYKKGKNCLTDVIYDLHNRKNSNVDFYKDLELPVE